MQGRHPRLWACSPHFLFPFSTLLKHFFKLQKPYNKTCQREELGVINLIIKEPFKEQAPLSAFKGFLILNLHSTFKEASLLRNTGYICTQL